MLYSVVLPPVLSESGALKDLFAQSSIDAELRRKMEVRAIELVERIRNDSEPGLMELFLGEYGLSSDEGVALMCLAEALLRVPDDATIDALIEDKIAPSAWGRHLGKSHSSLVNASTWALYVTGKVLNDDDDSTIATTLHSVIKRLGEPVIRQAVSRAMKEMGRQFVLGETIEKAMSRAEEKQAEGFTYSYDMLGEAACTERDARRYHLAYSDAISELGKAAKSDDIRANPGISIKLSALHPRYETQKRERVLRELVPMVRSLAVLAKSAGIGLNIDAEEAARLEISLEVIEVVVSDPVFEGWDGFGVVVQAYSKRAPLVLDWLYKLAEKLNRKFMVRLVKGAYWDTEIKHAQVEGHAKFPVYTRKPSTDVSYICCAEKLLTMTDRIYPQFATHNAHTVAAVLEMATDKSAFEFQRLHGMGEALHDTVLRRQGTHCRIYAPVGSHKDLLAYLVRRLLENGANSSFVNQIVDEDVAPELVAADPFSEAENYLATPRNTAIVTPNGLFQPERPNSKGWDISDPADLNKIEAGIATFDKKKWKVKSGSGEIVKITNPANGKLVGSVQFASAEDAAKDCNSIELWSNASAEKRAGILQSAADLYEENAFEIFSLLMREAGKTLLDCVGELREAVDFLRYYAAQAEQVSDKVAGNFTTIAPWNFPLAIFTGQTAAALAAGNGVLAKPAESTSLIAGFAVSLLWQAGVPKSSLKLVAGRGSEVGPVLTSHQNVDGVCFTGSTATAKRIDQSMAVSLNPHAVLIAETGGLNAMIVDSTALPEQAVKDIIASAFQSAGQRCSALRVLYLQEDIADPFMEMLFGAMDQLTIGDPRDFSTDIGPIISRDAASAIHHHIEAEIEKGNLLKQSKAPLGDTYISPTALKVDGIGDLKQEVFGPVLHIATYKSEALDSVIEEINNSGYGLTFGLHSRIDDRVQHIVDRVEAGNIYINRNQIGAVVGSQPFGGDKLSGTGPKAGGPKYLKRFLRSRFDAVEPVQGRAVGLAEVEAAFGSIIAEKPHYVAATEMPGPTGESNQYQIIPRGRVLCLGPTAELANEQLVKARKAGCIALAIAPGVPEGLDGVVSSQVLKLISDLEAVVSNSSELRETRTAMANRDGPIIPLLNTNDLDEWLVIERHTCINTTAAGGNAALLAG